MNITLSDAGISEVEYKKMYSQGSISTCGMNIPLTGTYNQNEMYKQIVKIINNY